MHRHRYGNLAEVSGRRRIHRLLGSGSGAAAVVAAVVAGRQERGGGAGGEGGGGRGGVQAGAGDVRGDVGVEVVVVVALETLLSRRLCRLDGQQVVLVHLSHNPLLSVGQQGTRGSQPASRGHVQFRVSKVGVEVGSRTKGNKRQPPQASSFRSATRVVLSRGGWFPVLGSTKANRDEKTFER